MHAFRISLAVASFAFALSACDRDPAPASANAVASTGDAMNSATATSNGITLRANVVETADLQESVARGYGIAREPNQALLLLTVRDAKGDDARPLSLQATVSDLKGGEQPLQLREIHAGDFTDRIGLVPLSAPDTLTFVVRAQLGAGSTSTVRLSRDFYPR